MTAAAAATGWLHSLFAALVHRPPVSTTSTSPPSAAVTPSSPSAEAAAASGGDAPAPRQALMGTGLVTALLSGVLLAILVYRELGNGDYSALLSDGDCLLAGPGLPSPNSVGGSPSGGGGGQGGGGAASASAPSSGPTGFPRQLTDAAEEAARKRRSDADLGRSGFLHWALRRGVLADNEAAYARTVQRREHTFDSAVEVRTTVPVYSCALKHRVGSWGEGGKWLCMLPQLTARKPVMYSIGCNGETSFERSLSELFRVRPFTFDPTLFPETRKAMQAIDYMHFTPVGLAGLGGEADVVPGTVTVEDLMAANGHGFVDIFKIDCEGCEEGFVDALVQRMDPGRPYFGQVLMEIHRVRSLESVNEKIVQKMEKLGYRPFNGEENFYCPSCFEIAFIHDSLLKPSDSTTAAAAAVVGAPKVDESVRQEALQHIAAGEVIAAEASAASAKFFAELAEEERKQQEAAARGDVVPGDAAAADAAAADAAAADAAASTPADGVPADSTPAETTGVEAAADPAADPAAAAVDEAEARQEAEPSAAAADGDAAGAGLAVDGHTGEGRVDSVDPAVGEAGEAATTAKDAGATAVDDGRDAAATSELLPSDAEGVSQTEASEVEEKDPSEMSAEERAAMRRQKGRGPAKKHRKGRKSGPSISMPF